MGVWIMVVLKKRYPLFLIYLRLVFELLVFIDLISNWLKDDKNGVSFV